MVSAWRPEFRHHLLAASGPWPWARSRSEPGGEQLPLQLAPPAQSWEELAGASVAYVRPLFLDKHSSVFASISPAFLTPSFRFLAAKPALCPGAFSAGSWGGLLRKGRQPFVRSGLHPLMLPGPHPTLLGETHRPDHTNGNFCKALPAGILPWPPLFSSGDIPVTAVTSSLSYTGPGKSDQAGNIWT